MALSDLQILRDLDRAIAAQHTELSLLRQEFRYSEQATATRLQAIEGKLDQRNKLSSFLAMNDKVTIKLILFLAFMAAGKPMAESLLLSLKAGL